MDYLEPRTWEEIYKELEIHKIVDTSFSGKDIIRLYEKNLDWMERVEVEEYFCVRCPSDLPDPVGPPIAPPPYLPPLPLLPIIVPSLPPPPPKLLPPPVPPSIPFLLPVFPFIVPSLLPLEFRNFLEDLFGVPDLHAEVFELQQNVAYWRKQYWFDYGRHVPKSPPRRPPLPTPEPEIEVEIPEKEPIPEEKYDPWEDFEDFDDWMDTDDETSPGEVDEEVDEGWYEGPSPYEQLLFYDLLELIEAEAVRLDIDFRWEYWYIYYGVTWYRFSIDNELYEWTIDELYDLLEEFKNIPTPDEIYI